MVDFTVQSKVISFPSDVGLVKAAINSLTALAKKHHLDLRQTYEVTTNVNAVSGGHFVLHIGSLYTEQPRVAPE